MSDDAKCLLKVRGQEGRYVLWRPTNNSVPIEDRQFMAHRLSRDGTVVGSLITFDIVKTVSFQNSVQESHPIRGGQRLSLLPGRISGVLSLEPFLLKGVYDETSGLTRVHFAFRAQDAKAYEYTAVAAPGFFWPPTDCQARLKDDCADDAEIELDTVIDKRKPFTVRLEERMESDGFGRTFQSSGRYRIRHKPFARTRTKGNYPDYL